MEKETLLVGEPMGLFIANTVGNLEDVSEYTLTTCGAEFNVAVGMSRLQHKVAYMTKLAKDPFGLKIIKMMKSNNISTDMIQFSETNPTGFMFKSKVLEGDPSIFYFRKGSAASTLCPEDVNKLDYSNIDIIHVTGITPALSETTRAATKALLINARKNNVIFSFDPNLRPQLWNSHQEMADYMNDLACQSDIFLPGIKEINSILGESNPELAAQYYLHKGTKLVIIKLGARGAYYATSTSNGYIDGCKVEKVVDTVGAGDGFAAGILSGIKEKLPIEESIRRANAIGAIQVMSKGDNDGLPTREELKAFMNGDKNWRIQ